ncbi:hypothetical protein E2C01_073690 [Portunus trituberculatus]|uniref:Uncharacterized protein n=1 Tax=Portunus trituberculatus TaxID=210409 RepID=A0A5B7IBA1_PORTR|nr:hypothetical protein [Portunus trituberculatus]
MGPGRDGYINQASQRCRSCVAGPKVKYQRDPCQDMNERDGKRGKMNGDIIKCNAKG